jgi:hypothetical protein
MWLPLTHFNVKNGRRYFVRVLEEKERCWLEQSTVEIDRTHARLIWDRA